MEVEYKELEKKESDLKEKYLLVSVNLASSKQYKIKNEAEIKKAEEQLTLRQTELVDARVERNVVRKQLEKDEMDEQAYLKAHADDIAVGYSSNDLMYLNQKDVEGKLRGAGFRNIKKLVYYDIYFGITSEGEVDNVVIDGTNDFKAGDKFNPDASVEIYYHSAYENDPQNKLNTKTQTDMEVEQNTSNQDLSGLKSGCYYSSNTLEVARKGNSGVFCYKQMASDYEQYYIIDFDEECVYYFSTNDSMCMRMKNISGDLNNGLTVNYKDGDTEWTEILHFHYKEQPTALILLDKDCFEIKFIPGDLDTALMYKKSMEIVDF